MRSADFFSSERASSVVTIPSLSERNAHDHVVLLQTEAGRLKSESKMRSNTKGAISNPAGWFGDESEGESTYTYDGTLAHRNLNPEIDVMDGWDPNPTSLNLAAEKVRNEEWFHETESGGYKQAWQSFFPPLPASTPGSEVQTGQWFTRQAL